MAKIKSDEEKRKRKTELQRMRRQIIRNDANAHELEKAKERERWKKRVEQGKVKKIKDLPRRDQKVQRVKWVESAKKYREKKSHTMRNIRFLEKNTPPSSPVSFNDRQGTSRQNVGRRRIRRDRAKAYRTIAKLKSKLDVMNKLHAKYKSKYYRLLKKSQNLRRESPNSKVSEMLRNCKVPPEVRRTLVFHEVLTTQISSNLENIKRKPERVVARKILTGPLIKKYKFVGKNFISRCKKKQIERKEKTRELEKKVIGFYEKDSCSRLRNQESRNGIKKQKRLLNKPLQLLHKDFMRENDILISYALFCRLRPFWIVFPNINKRDSCLCTMCENEELLVKKLKILGIINESSAELLAKSICCKEQSENCLQRKCLDCIGKQITFNDYSPEDEAIYLKWTTITQKILVSGKEKECKKVVRIKVRCKKIEMTKSLIDTIASFSQHIANRNHQYKELDALKKNLRENEIVLHMDFSENYVCKYNREIQSMHFGGSKEQAVLHTVVAYYMSHGNVLHQSYCTVSECPRKDPVAILAHLKPLFCQLVEQNENITKVHFISDGPSTQYRNFEMFYIFGLEIPKLLPALRAATWNYTEKGHGKGAPDGVGGALKRRADELVSLGGDIPNVSSLVDILKANITKVVIIHIPTEEIDTLHNILPQKIERFRGCLQTHQVTWSRGNPVLNFRRLTCNNCEEFDSCSHYHIGSLPINPGRLRVTDVYSSDSDSDDQPLSCYLENNSDEHNYPLSFQVGDYLVVRFVGKKSIKHYIGCTTRMIDSDNYELKFLRQSQQCCFVYPTVNDIAVVEKKFIIKILDRPVIDKRGHHFFKPSLTTEIENLC